MLSHNITISLEVPPMFVMAIRLGAECDPLQRSGYVTSIKPIAFHLTQPILGSPLQTVADAETRFLRKAKANSNFHQQELEFVQTVGNCQR